MRSVACNKNNNEEIWERIKIRLTNEYGNTVFNTWLKHLTFIEVNGGEILFSVPTRFIRDWINSHYKDKALAFWRHEDTSILAIKIIVGKKEESSPKENSSLAKMGAQKVNIFDINDSDDDISSPLDRRFTFDNFVVGPANELCFAAANSIAQNKGVLPGSNSNPLYIYGGVGLGKTHTMHAIALHIRKNDANRRVAYLSAEKFMYLFVTYLKNKDILSFKKKFRNIDVLMIDDIQFISGKPSTQEEFYHTFNALIDQNKQIVIAGDRSPSDLDGVDDRIKSRFSGGLVVDIGKSDYDLRLGVLHAKVKQMKNVNIPKNVLEFLADKITSNIRELEGGLNKVVAHSALMGKPIDLQGAGQILSDLLRANQRVLTIADIQRKVADYFNIKMSDMTSTRRLRSIARPRQIAMYLAKSLTSRSLSEIGRKFGGKDHTTVMHALKRIEDLMQEDSEIKEDVDLLIRALSQ